jgi:transcriptional regulator with XRE-family HTH domain
MGEEIKKLLLEKYLARQQELGERISLKAFADWIGIDDKYLNHIMNGRRNLSPRMAELFAEFFNDPRFYDLAGMDRPNPGLQYVSRHWEKVPEDIQRKIAEEISKYTTEPNPKE